MDEATLQRGRLRRQRQAIFPLHWLRNQLINVTNTTLATLSPQTSNGPAPLGFLDLPLEARMKIYSYLLLGYTRHWDNDHPERPADTILSPLRIESSRRRAYPTTLHRWLPKTEDSEAEPIYPEILSTCVSICYEGAPVLYGQNIFAFSSHYDQYLKNLQYPPDCLPFQVVYACTRLMSHDINDWTVKTVTSPVTLSSFAAFVRKIGPRNAHHHDTFHAARDMALATVVCVQYLRSLERILLYVDEIPVHLDESAEYFHPNPASRFWSNGQFESMYRTMQLESMYRAVQDFVEHVYWLHAFKYCFGLDQSGVEVQQATAMLQGFANFVIERRRKQWLMKEMAQLPVSVAAPAA
ncbi:MAG: hypothetical protein LQ348_007387 [Seirophora lacunosa]|nr:MAG: hypothetical protein LQ348_007387 [Seirophora lacunosa]